MGRRRRASDSTVATVDEDTIRYIKETNFLKSAPPEELDQYNFVLEDVTVYDKKGQLADLLSVSFNGPFIVRGFLRLEEEDEVQLARCRKSNAPSSYIEIQDCVRYAIGTGGDEDSPCIWAEGKCGWFEIRPPSAEYAPVYNEMAQAVSLYYRMQVVHEDWAKTHRTKRRKGSRKPSPTSDDTFSTLDPETMFLKYAVVAGDGSVMQEVIDACDEQAPFLISHFYKEEEFGVDLVVRWDHTTFFKWLTARHPDVHTKVLNNERKGRDPKGAASLIAQITRPAADVDEPPTQKAVAKATGRRPAQTKDIPEAEVESRDFAPARARSLRSKSSDKVIKSPPPSAEQVQAMDVDTPRNHTNAAAAAQTPGLPDELDPHSPVAMLFNAIESIRVSSSKPASKLAFSAVRQQLYYKFKIKSYPASGDILKYFASDILPLLDENVWGGSPFYIQVQRDAQQQRLEPVGFDPEDMAKYMVARNKLNNSANSGSYNPNTSQPRSAGVRVPGVQRDDEVSQFETPPPRKRGRPSGKMSGLRPSTKRRITTEEDEVVGAGKGFKIARSDLFNRNDDDTMQDAEASDQLDSSDDEDGDPAGSERAEPVKVVIRAEKLPDLTPKGPNGTWVCEQGEECDFVERNPDDPGGKERIQQHIREAHIEEDVEDDEGRLDRVNLARIESERGHLPIEYAPPFSFPSPPPHSDWMHYDCAYPYFVRPCEQGDGQASEEGLGTSTEWSSLSSMAFHDSPNSSSQSSSYAQTFFSKGFDFEEQTLTLDDRG